MRCVFFYQKIGKYVTYTRHIWWTERGHCPVLYCSLFFMLEQSGDTLYTVDIIHMCSCTCVYCYCTTSEINCSTRGWWKIHSMGLKTSKQQTQGHRRRLKTNREPPGIHIFFQVSPSDGKWMCIFKDPSVRIINKIVGATRKSALSPSYRE